MIGTYTLLDTYKKCPHQAYRRYFTKDFPFKPTKASEWGNKVHEAMDRRCSARQPLPLDMQQWESFARPFDAHKVATEQKLAMDVNGHAVDYWDKNCWFRGKADLVIFDRERAYIGDWKTGNSRYEDPFELATNAMLLKANHPQLTQVGGCYLWLKDMRVGQYYDVSDFNATWRTVHDLMTEMAGKKRPEDWEKTKSPLCGYCPVADCEHWHEAR